MAGPSPGQRQGRLYSDTHLPGLLYCEHPSSAAAQGYMSTAVTPYSSAGQSYQHPTVTPGTTGTLPQPYPSSLTQPHYAASTVAHPLSSSPTVTLSHPHPQVGRRGRNGRGPGLCYRGCTILAAAAVPHNSTSTLLPAGSPEQCLWAGWVPWWLWAGGFESFGENLFGLAQQGQGFARASTNPFA